MKYKCLLECGHVKVIGDLAVTPAHSMRTNARAPLLEGETPITVNPVHGQVYCEDCRATVAVLRAEALPEPVKAESKAKAEPEVEGSKESESEPETA